MPKEVFGHEYRFLPRRELLTFEEIERVARVFVDLGVQKLRITGGEPLLRRDLELLIARLSALGDDLDVTLTTNAALLAQKAQALADAGLSRITVSLDSLDDEVFRAMNDVDFPVARVLAGIDAAAAAGLPVKVNIVVKRGLNEASILESPGASVERATRSASSSSWTSARRTAGASTTSSPPPRSSRRSAPSSRSSPWSRVSRRGRRALPLSRRRGRDRRHRVGDPAVLRRLHACADLRGREALHLPLRRTRPRPPCAAPLGLGGRARRDDPRGVDAPRRSLLRDPHRGTAALRKVEMSYIGG